MGDEGPCQKRCGGRTCRSVSDEVLKRKSGPADPEDDNAGLNNLVALVLPEGTQAKPVSGTKRVGEDGPRQLDGLRSPGIDLPCI